MANKIENDKNAMAAFAKAFDAANNAVAKKKKNAPKKETPKKKK